MSWPWLHSAFPYISIFHQNHVAIPRAPWCCCASPAEGWWPRTTTSGGWTKGSSWCCGGEINTDKFMATTANNGVVVQNVWWWLLVVVPLRPIPGQVIWRRTSQYFRTPHNQIGMWAMKAGTEFGSVRWWFLDTCACGTRLLELWPPKCRSFPNMFLPVAGFPQSAHISG